MTVHWTPETLTDHTQIRDALGRVFTYHQGRLIYGTYWIPLADAEWPVTTGDSNEIPR